MSKKNQPQSKESVTVKDKMAEDASIISHQKMDEVFAEMWNSIQDSHDEIESEDFF